MREQHTLTELSPRVLVIAVIYVVLVISTTMFVEPWKLGHLNLAAKILGSSVIVTQMVMLVLDIATLVACVCPYATIILTNVHQILSTLQGNFAPLPPTKYPVQE